MEKPMKLKSKHATFNKLRRKEDGAEAVEFALISPILFFLVFGLIYVLLMFAAQLSLGYATNVGVRYAAIPTSSTTYPSPTQVLNKAMDATPFFNTSVCTPDLTSGAANQPVIFTLSCNFPNPIGNGVNAVRRTLFSGGSDVDSTIQMSATAQSRKE
jgi:Flp pilus assembly protein TadG